MMIAAANIGNVGDFLTGIGTIILAVGTIVAAIIAAISYRRQVELNRQIASEHRVRWLGDLQSRLSDQPDFQLVRRMLYEEMYGKPPGPISELLGRKEALDNASGQPAGEDQHYLRDDDFANLVRLDNYLDFLGTVNQLVEGGSLSKTDAVRIFGWYCSPGLKFPALQKEILANFPDVKEFIATADKVHEEYLERKRRAGERAAP